MTLVSAVTDPIDIIRDVLGVAFGAGATFATLNASIKATKIRAETAVAETARALEKCAALLNEVTKLRGEFERHVAILATREEERRSQVTQSWLGDRLAEQNDYLSAIAKKAGASVQRRDIPRQDSDNPSPMPPMRGRLGSRRE